LGVKLTDFLPNLRRMKYFPGATVNRAWGNLGYGGRRMEGAARCSHADFMNLKDFIYYRFRVHRCHTRSNLNPGKNIYPGII
jgi:hypothetical protein